MLNKLNKELKQAKKAVDKNSNDFNDPALSKAEDLIKSARYEAQPADDNFKQKLKSEIMKSRTAKQKNMPNFKQIFAQFLKPKVYIPVLSFVLIIAVLMTSLYLWPSPGQQGPYNFTSLFINAAYAQDNFEVEATEADSTGVDSTTAFIITSKDLVDPDILKENIQLVPSAEFDFDKISDYQFKVTPKEQLEDKTIYNLQITSSYVAENNITMARDYSWAFQVKDQFKILRTLPGNQSNNVPIDSGIEVVFSHENFTDYDNALTISPKVEGRYEKHDRTLVFVPKALEAGTIYTVTVNKDNISVEDSEQMLKEDYTFQFETDPGNLKSSTRIYFNFADTFVEFSTEQNPAIQVWGENELNKDSVEMTLYSYSDVDEFVQELASRNKVPYWASFNSSKTFADTNNLTKVMDVDFEIQEYDYYSYLLLPDNLAQGYYVLDFNYDDVRRQLFIQVTNVAVYTSMTSTDTMFWVNDIETDQPINNARVELIDETVTAKSNLSTKTNEQGIALINTADFVEMPFDENYASYIFKITDNNRSIVVTAGVSEWTYNYNTADSYWNYFYTDRNKYLPDDEIQFWGFIKNRSNEEIDDQVTVRFKSYSNYYNYYYEPMYLAQQSFDLQKNNVIDGSLKLDQVEPGYYGLELVVGEEVIYSKYITVEAYTKPAYEITIEMQKDAVYADESNVAHIKAAFFDGTPVAGLELMVDGETVITDANGEAIYTATTAYVDCTKTTDYCYYPKIKRVNVYPKQSEEGDIHAESSFLVFGPSVEVDVDMEKTGDFQAELTATVNNIDIDKANESQGIFYKNYLGDTVAGISLEGELYEFYYKKYETGEYYDFINKKVYKEYEYKKVENKLADITGVTSRDGEYSYGFATESSKSYRVELRVADSKDRHDEDTAYLWGGNYRYDSYFSYSDNFYQLQIKGKDRTGSAEYLLDEQVNIDFVKGGVVLPKAENNNYLYYQMQNGLSDYAVTNSGQYNFDFSEEHIPNVVVKGVYFDGTNFHVSQERWPYGDGVTIKSAPENRKLEIKVTTDKKQYRPGEEITLQAKVTDTDGHAVKADINFNLVDEAFYKLAEDFSNPLVDLYSNVKSGELFSHESHVQPEIGGGAEGGGCFTAGTQITMADNSYKNIEDIKVGDRILTFKDQNSQQLVAGEVVKVYEHMVPGYWVINNSLEVTPEHRVFVNGGWQMIGEAKIGDWLKDENGNFVEIQSIEKIHIDTKVYNFEVKNYHTYLANGIYVHNEKGGEREVFKDTAGFVSTQTDSRGNAQVTMTLPDNITSWRVTTQAISDDLYAGISVENVSVSLPMFVNTTFAKEYLVGDKPSVKMRAYGTELTSDTDIDFTVNSESLGIDDRTASAKAYQAAYVALGALTSAGEHKVSVKAESAQSDDTVIKPISVLDSRLTTETDNFYTLAENLQVEGSQTDRTLLTFTDKGQGQFYWKLRRLSWTYGDRVDQKLSRIMARDLLENYFEEENYFSEEFQGSVYQQDGGIMLLPYTEPDFELSAKAAALAPERFDQVALSSYFYSILNNKDSNREEIAIALWGLAGMQEPILLEVQGFGLLEDLTPKEKIYAALAAYEIGDKELARDLYLELLDEYGEEYEKYARLNVGEDNDDILESTALAMILAGGLNDEKHDNFWQYVDENEYSSEVLVKMEKLLYVKEALPQLRPGAVQFSVIIDGEKVEKTLEKGQSYKVSVTPEQLANIQYADISGNVGLTSSYEMPVENIFENVSDLINIKREYYVDGQKTTDFAENDLVQIKITVSFNDKAPVGSYQVADLLPSGMSILTNLCSRDLSSSKKVSEKVRYPYEINGQQAKFSIYKDFYEENNQIYFNYYARVVNPGEYQAESAMVQSFKDKGIRNYSTAQTVNISK